MFNSTGPHYCPDCKPVINSKGIRIDVPLKLITNNYSGCGIDIAICDKCNQKFQISYKVDKIIKLAK